MTNKQIATFLQKRGYTVLETSVHGKNQTRFAHFVIEKAGTKYFCKANLSTDVLEAHTNTAVVQHFGKPPAGVHFLQPVHQEVSGDTVIHFYPYIAQMPVSNESKKFKDFDVSAASRADYFDRILAATTFVRRQKVLTIHERKRAYTAATKVIELLKRLPSDTPSGLELLKFMLREGENLGDYALAVSDLQPQNTFWLAKEKALYLFDLEHMAPQPKFYDEAYFAVELWCVYGHPEYAKEFLQQALQSVTTRECPEMFRLLRYNLVGEALMQYSLLESRRWPERRRNVTTMLRWLRHDFLEMANSTPEANNQVR